MRVAFTTLGCKINQYETDLMRRSLLTAGDTIVPFGGEADVYVINTCSVTGKSDYQCRQVIKSAVKRGHGAKVVVTGCYAETRPEEIRNIAGVDLVIGNKQKTDIRNHITRLNGACSEATTSPSKTVQPELPRSRTRGFLKIQDGCDGACTYCIVPLARGKPRSENLEHVMKEFDRMVQAGCPEIVLSGIHIGKYGIDLNPGMNLTELLKILVERRGKSRIRLSSIEPREITPEMIGLLGRGLCRHLHIPLQSGDDTILSSMNRDYSSVFYMGLLENISKGVPGVALGADVMVGFPGEGEAEFRNTLHLIEKSPLTHLHVFSFSPRPGTPAAIMTRQMKEKVKKERNELLRALGRRKNLEFRRKFLGSYLDVVVEDKIDAATGSLTGLTDNYIRACIPGLKSDSVREKVSVKIIEVTETHTFARI